MELEGPSFSLGLTQMCETSHHMSEHIGQGTGAELASEIIGDVLAQLQHDDVADASKGHRNDVVETECGVSIVKGKSAAPDVTNEMVIRPGKEGATMELESERAIYKRKRKGRVHSKKKI